MKHLILTLCPLIAISAGLAVGEPANLADAPPDRPREPVDWVDCLIGTSSSRWMLYPGPSMPFGMVKLSPDNQGDDPAVRHWKAGYEYTIDNIMGFSHVHSWTMGGLLTMPATGPLRTQPGPEDDPDAGYRSRFRHGTETASPGYYAVTLDDYGIRAELTCTTRAGFQRYTFPESREARILFDLWIPTEYGTQVTKAVVEKVSDTEIAGSVEMSAGLHYQAVHYQDYTLHFVARTSRPFDSMDHWHGDKVSRDVMELAGRGDTGVCLNFKTAQGERILLQTGISLVSIDQARLNLDTEMKRFGWDFDACHQAARTTWNDLLGRVLVEGGREVDHRKFYTNLYRAYCARTIWSDVNGKYTDMYERVQQLADPASPVYGSDALWNTFWNLNPLWNLVTPDISEKWVRSLLEIYDNGGWLPKGPAGIEYSSIMEASHAIPINHGNQPSMQVAYLFNHADAPWLTQKWVRAIMDRYYGDTPHDGWSGDEDQGQGGAWFAMSALGLFQTDGGCRVEPSYEIGSPLFDRAVIRLDPACHPGGRFVIEAPNNGPRNVFIQSATLNGKPLDKPWFYASEALAGGHLVLHMGPEPNRAWGIDTGDAPARFR